MPACIYRKNSGLEKFLEIYGVLEQGNLDL